MKVLQELNENFWNFQQKYYVLVREVYDIDKNNF
jgi:hypothetical protein